MSEFVGPPCKLYAILSIHPVDRNGLSGDNIFMAHVNCPNCGKRLRFSDTSNPVRIQCPICKHTFQPSLASQSPAASDYSEAQLGWVAKTSIIVMALAGIALLAFLVYKVANTGSPGLNEEPPQQLAQAVKTGEKSQPVVSTQPSGISPRQIAAKVSPSVVLLVMQDVNGQPVAMASGFVVRDGVIATNLHVIEGAARGYAKLVDQKTKYNVRGVVASDPARDLVLLAIDGLKAASLTVGDSSQVAVGDNVFAVGNPRGLEGTFSAGVVSSIRKVGADWLLQITAPISPGSSGGPVVNSKGEVIGVAVATFKGGQNLNFAIPSRYLSALIPAIKAPQALPKAAKARKNKKEKSILDEMGGRSTEGVEASDFLWEKPVLQWYGKYSFTLRNKLRDPVKNVICAVIFHNDKGEVIDFDLVTYSGIIPPGLGKRASSQIDESVQKLTSKQGDKTPQTNLKFRVLYFELVTGE